MDFINELKQVDFISIHGKQGNLLSKHTYFLLQIEAFFSSQMMMVSTNYEYECLTLICT